ncbi:amino-acid N-acetyltransferase [Thiocapsa roseopersicina]|uniref:Amino-acid acetyltransferase n=1 Tax=Thiocapsa roseopersicina TaxID=1058 RepID=A0A1H2XNE6_THIRO|nr:amino-acid N-acetyltransferase [Thiocapsa roseopersicina]SDW94198.1 N-acetylglutamate synthase [Thiocapsa roseopersicina]
MTPSNPDPNDPAPPRDPFVDWVRQATPYIHAHRGRTFVIVFGGEAVADPRFPDLVHDIALLHGLGIRLVLVHGARPQIEARLAGRGAQLRYVNGLRITDQTALACVKEAAGVVRVEIEALLSLGLANSPMAGVRIPVVSGNFVTARPLGVIDGVDYAHTGAVRRIDRQTLRAVLDQGAVALMPPLGYSPTGEVFNLSAADVARGAAVALGADKLIFLTEDPVAKAPIGDGSPNSETRDLPQDLLGPNLLARDIDALLAASSGIPEDVAQCLRAGADACRNGIRRVHLVQRRRGGALLRELLTPDGSGTLISAEPYEELRPARIDDVTGILELLRPLEDRGVLVRRSRERLETEIDRFFLTERDGLITACAALYSYPSAGMAELACVAVHQDYRATGRGDRLLAHMEDIARAAGIERLFVLTTQTAHWFRERGFEPASLGALPMERQALYNFQRNSQVYIKAV